MESVIRKRPKLITAVCVLGFIWIVFSFPAVFSPSVKKLGDWYPALYGLIVAFSFIAYIGVWHMKRWGVHLFIITFFIKEMLLIFINDLNYIGLSISAFFIIVMVYFYKKMDVNL
ncbi:MAG: hypothetical protein V4608_05280 [Bacteroidota bacterium]